MKPAYYRIKYNLTELYSSNLSIEKDFKELHHLVKASAKPLENLIGTKILNHEAIYLTLLIGGWLTRQGNPIHERLKAIVVCPEGVSLSRIMLSTLRELFPEFSFVGSLSVREYESYTKEYDIVFSSVMLSTNKKLFVVNQYPTIKERIRLRRRVEEEIFGYSSSIIKLEYMIETIKKYAHIDKEEDLRRELIEMFQSNLINNQILINNKGKRNLNDFLYMDNIMLGKTATSWEEAIRTAAIPLLSSGNITERYVDAIIQNYNYENPYIILGSKMAIPHAA